MGLWVAELYYSYYYYLSFYFIQSGSGPVGSRTVVFSQVMELTVAAQKICVFKVLALKNLGMLCRHYDFILSK